VDALNSLTTIVLPVHNAERDIRETVVGILDLAEILARCVQIAIVDDGSIDGTFEAASDLAREFPQVRVLHQAAQRGLGDALEQVRLRLGVEQVIAHDGIARIDLDELATLLLATGSSAQSPPPIEMSNCGSRRMTGSAITGGRRSRSASFSSSFRWLRLDEPLVPRRRSSHLPQPVHEVKAASAVVKTSLIGPFAATI
jgi:glycosyltransferase involved in cell wall biosynthesis